MNKKQLRSYSFICLKAWKNTRWHSQDKNSCSLVLSILKKINKCKFDSGIDFIDLDYLSYNGYKLMINANNAIIEFDVREGKIYHLRVFNKLNKKQHGLNNLKFIWLNNILL